MERSEEKNSDMENMSLKSRNDSVLTGEKNMLNYSRPGWMRF